MKSNEKTVIITGAGQGIGKAISFAFGERGFNVIVADINFEKAKTVSKEMCEMGFKSIPIKVDVSISSEVESMVKKVIDEFRQIHVLINNAGIQTVTSFLELTEDEWDRVINVNLKGTFLCSQIVAREMRMYSYGKIINISSIHHSIARLNKTHYDVSKAGVEMLTKDMALELAKYKINVNSIAPGAIITPMNIDILNSDEKKAETANKIPWKRMGKPEEIASVALFLADDKSDYITGTTISVDGGLSLSKSS